MLIILREEDKLRESNDIDNIIPAEIPDENEEPGLFEIVKSCMIHGPCGSLNPNCVCMEMEYAKRIFQKNLERRHMKMLTVIQHMNEETMAELLELVVLSLTTDILYHIMQISLKNTSHINIEACASVKSVKYLFKYMFIKVMTVLIWRWL